MDTKSHPIPTTFDSDVFSALEKFDRRVYFRWDLTTDVLELHGPAHPNSYDIAPRIAPASTILWHSGLLHQEDATILRVYLNTIFCHHIHRPKGSCNHICKLRLRGNGCHEYIWSEIHLITYFDGFMPVVAYGNIRNIQAQKLWQQRIEREAAHDQLTGLLNKDATRLRITKHLASLSPDIDQEALLIIDADGFKEINDSFGHLFGDAVLTDMGNAIMHNFRQSDIKGRIGGDEFLVLFRNISDPEILHDRCQSLIRQLERRYKNGQQELPFSISIGVAQYPQHGTTYQELFKHADRALYESKNLGKNQYTIYRSSLLGQASVTSHRTPKDFEDFQQKAFKDNMIEFIFKLLYETNSPDATISISLGMFGKLFNLARVGLDLYDPDTNQYTTAYEWLSPNGISLKSSERADDTFDSISMRNTLILSGYKATSYGVMSICEDTSKAADRYQPAMAALHLGAFAHCMITHGSDTLGCIGFEYSRPHTIDDECRHALSVFAVILGNILLTSYSDDKLRQQNMQLRSLLDHMQEMIYVVDKITMSPIYFNRSIRQALPDVNAGHPCYQVLHKRSTPCPGCPVLQLSGEGSEYIQCDLNNWDKDRPTCTRACNLHIDKVDDTRPLALVIQEPI